MQPAYLSALLTKGRFTCFADSGDDRKLLELLLLLTVIVLLVFTGNVFCEEQKDLVIRNLRSQRSHVPSVICCVSCLQFHCTFVPFNFLYMKSIYSVLLMCCLTFPSVHSQVFTYMYLMCVMYGHGSRFLCATFYCVFIDAVCYFSISLVLV